MPCCVSRAASRRRLQESRAERELAQRLLAAPGLSSAPVERVAVGRRFVAVQAGGRVGLASTLGARAGEGPCPWREAPGRPLSACLPWLLSPEPLLSSLGLAALNAACPPPPPGQLWEGSAQQWLLQRARGLRVVLVGSFPFAPELRAAAENLEVLELEAGAPPLPPPEWDEALDECHLLAVTGTALLTGYLAYFLGKAPQAFKLVLGPSTPWSPLLFEQGAHMLAGALVREPEPVLAAVEQGLPYREIKKAGIESVCWFPKSAGFTHALD